MGLLHQAWLPRIFISLRDFYSTGLSLNGSNGRHFRSSKMDEWLHQDLFLKWSFSGISCKARRKARGFF